jgi:REP element-mobilizing transposase RayT
MRDTYHRLYVHAIWATWDRLPLITPNLEAAVYADIRVEAGKIKAQLIEIGGMEDHVHIVARIPPTLSVAELLKQVKGVSSHMTMHSMPGGETFKWQGAYAAFTVSEADLPRIRSYVRNQKEHHRTSSLLQEYEIGVIEQA